MLSKEDILALKVGDFIQENPRIIAGVAKAGDSTRYFRVDTVYFVDRDINDRTIVEVLLIDEDGRSETRVLREGNVKLSVMSTPARGRKSKSPLGLANKGAS